MPPERWILVPGSWLFLYLDGCPTGQEPCKNHSFLPPGHHETLVCVPAGTREEGGLYNRRKAMPNMLMYSTVFILLREPPFFSLLSSPLPPTHNRLPLDTLPSLQVSLYYHSNNITITSHLHSANPIILLINQLLISDDVLKHPQQTRPRCPLFHRWQPNLSP